jgi:hypothetical protein
MSYPTITAGEMLDACLQANGMDPDHYTLTANERTQYGTLINLALRKAWEAELWPQLMVIERRTYRPTWAADVNYSRNHEVFYSGEYWRSNAENNLGHAPAEGSALWTECSADMIPYIAFDQPWATRVIDETGIEWARCVFDEDPQLHPDTPPAQGCRPYEQSILVPIAEAALQPYVRFRPARTKIGYTEWSGAATYAAGTLRYRGTTTKECYLALAPSTGKVPEDEAAYWTPVGLPEMFEDYIRMRVRAERAADDEGKYKALAQADQELDRLREVYLHVSGDRLGRRVNWRTGR